MSRPVRISEEHHQMVKDHAEDIEEEMGFKPNYKAIVEGAIEEYTDGN